MFSLSSCLVVVFVFLNSFDFAFTGFEFQRERIFDNVCANCIVSGGLGFASDPNNCNCYYTCVLRAADKLADSANPWVSYLRCCPCHTTFSKKLLTCVDYTDKRSDCFDTDLGNNPCVGNAGNNLLTQDPNNVDRPLCSGFISCEEVGDAVVPNPSCCPANTCYDEYIGICIAEACDYFAYCADLRPEERDDCECDHTPEPTTECSFMPVTGAITQFMGVQNMKLYNCAAGTCWDQDTCTCVRTNNTGYSNDACDPIVNLDFDNDFTARDRQGNTIWTDVVGTVTNNAADEAVFVGDGYVGVGGLANSYLGHKFSMHFKLSLTSQTDRLECLVGTCVNGSDVNPADEKFYITVENESGAEDLVTVHMTYKDTQFWIPGVETTEAVTLQGSAELEVNDAHEFWLFYGWDEQVVFGVTEEGTNVILSDATSIAGSVQLVPPQSGFLFGHCQNGDDFIGTLAEVEMWRGCKPYDNTEFIEAYEAILNSL